MDERLLTVWGLLIVFDGSFILSTTLSLDIHVNGMRIFSFLNQ